MNRENDVYAFAEISLRAFARALKVGPALALAAVLAACSGGGAPTTVNPITSAPVVQDYSGPVPQNADVQAFALNLWKNIRTGDRCGGCHNANGQSPQFARSDDVNAAYQAANTVVNLAQPDQSRMVQKVGGGHNCWLASASACADTLTVWIRNWAGSTATGGKQIELKEPDIKTVGDSKAFPDSSAAFASTLWNPILKPFCARCHSATGGQQPYFAAADVDEAYAAAKAKINLDSPANSRFYLRLHNESHNCWALTAGGQPDCNGPDGMTGGSAKVMLDAITAFASGITPTQIDPSLVVSKALSLYDGTVAAGGNRYDTNVIALYEFKTGSGPVAYDTSGVEPALNLTLTDPLMWVGGWGINIKDGQSAYGSTTASKKLSDQIKATGEFSVEAWMAPADVVQEDAYAVTYSAGKTARNFTLGQHAYQYEAMTRTSETDANGKPSLLTSDKDKDAQASLQHVVLTYDPINGRKIYVNGQFTGDVDPKGGGGSLTDWDDSFKLVLGNEASNDRKWSGVIRLVAIHNRALTLEQVQQNFAAGVGERYFLLFNVSDLVGVPKAYMMFEGSEYDSYSYLFNKPTFISLDPNATIPNIDISGIRIGVNGAEARVGQTYAPFSATIGGSNYQKGTGQLLSNTGAVIAADRGPMSDQFFLTFEKIGSHSHAVSEPAVTAPVAPDNPAQPEYGMRTFDELNATYSKLTGVPMSTDAVVTTFANVKQQLPSVESIDAFLASHQTGIAQLAIAYCSAMINSAPLRQAFFGGAGNDIDPNQMGSIFNGAGTQAANRDRVINALGTRFVGDLASQPTQTEIYNEIDSLLTSIAQGASGSKTDGAGTAMKGACAAVLGSAAVTVQ